jgi:hypothetical protein
MLMAANGLCFIALGFFRVSFSIERLWYISKPELVFVLLRRTAALLSSSLVIFSPNWSYTSNQLPCVKSNICHPCAQSECQKISMFHLHYDCRFLVIITNACCLLY